MVGFDTQKICTQARDRDATKQKPQLATNQANSVGKGNGEGGGKGQKREQERDGMCVYVWRERTDERERSGQISERVADEREERTDERESGCTRE